MKHKCKFSSIFNLYILTAIILLFCITQYHSAFGRKSYYFCNVLTVFTDTIPIPVKDTVPKKIIADSLFEIKKDSTIFPGNDTLNLKISKDTFSAPIKYHAADSAIALIQQNKFILYGKSKTDYDDVKLAAPKIELDQKAHSIIAVSIKDSTGYAVEKASFEKGVEKFVSDSLAYNFKSQKGISKNTITQSGEMFLHGEKVKKVSANVTFMQDALITTCNLDEPHFAFRAKRIKNVQDKVTVTGKIYPEFEGVTFPVPFPYGYFPNKSIKGSGFLPPRFATDEIRGLGLEEFGYYKVFNDYWDARFSGTIYSYGSWLLRISPSYRKRYRYSGSFGLSITHNVTNFKGDPDYTANNLYGINWSHTMDGKARPGVNFSASVNASSTQLARNTPGDPRANYSYGANSQIRYSRTFQDKPYSFNISASHSQNNQLGLVTLSLPTLDFNLNTVYPFQRKISAGSQKWYEKFGIGYSTSFDNQTSFYDTINYGGITGLLRHLLDTARWSVRHNIPITFSLPALFGGALIVSPGISYNQSWVQKATQYKWDETSKTLDTIYKEGIFIDQQSSMSLSASTGVFGTYQLKKASIRHVIRPSIGLSYTPDFNKNHIKNLEISDTLGIRKLKYNEMTGSIENENFQREFAGLTFNLSNVLQMKTKDKNDTTGKEFKRINLIDAFNIGGSYNLLKDSNQLSHIGISFQTNLFNKINISANSSLNPYIKDSLGYDTKKYAWQGGKFSLGKLQTTSISANTSFSSKPKDPAKANNKKKELEDKLNDPTMQANRDEYLNYIKDNPSEFVDFNVPWQVSLSYSLVFANQKRRNLSGYEVTVSSNLNFNGSFSLTPKWNFSVDGYYNFDQKKLTNFNLSINRDMHCWQLSISVTPIASYGGARYFSFTISPKSTLLQDLRINRTRTFYSR